MTTSAPSPSVTALTISSASSSARTSTSAPSCLAACRRLSALSIATMCDGEQQPGGQDRGEPDRSGAHHDDGVARTDGAIQDADLV